MHWRIDKLQMTFSCCNAAINGARHRSFLVISDSPIDFKIAKDFQLKNSKQWEENQSKSSIMDKIRERCTMSREMKIFRRGQRESFARMMIVNGIEPAAGSRIEHSWNLRYSPSHYPFTGDVLSIDSGLEGVTRVSPTYDTLASSSAFLRRYSRSTLWFLLARIYNHSRLASQQKKERERGER